MNHLKWLDSLFSTMGNPTILLDGVIASGQFSDWIDAHEEEVNDKLMWDYYVHKLGAWDDRSFDDFKGDIMKGVVKKIERPSDEQLSATVKNSYEMLNSFEISEERG